MGSEIIPRVTDFLRSLPVRPEGLRSSKPMGWEAMTGEFIAEFEVEFGFANAAVWEAPDA